MRNIPIGRIKYLSDNVVRAMVSEGLDEDLRYGLRTVRKAAIWRAKRICSVSYDERCGADVAEDFVPLSELSKTALGQVFTMKKWDYYLTPSDVPERARVMQLLGLQHN